TNAFPNNEHPNMKPFLSLEISDLQNHPIWEAVVDNEPDVTVFPVASLPVPSLLGRVVGATVRLANRQVVWAIIQHLGTLTVRIHTRISISLLYESSGTANGLTWLVIGTWTIPGTVRKRSPAF